MEVRVRGGLEEGLQSSLLSVCCIIFTRDSVLCCAELNDVCCSALHYTIRCTAFCAAYCILHCCAYAVLNSVPCNAVCRIYLQKALPECDILVIKASCMSCRLTAQTPITYTSCTPLHFIPLPSVPHVLLLSACYS